MLSFHLDLELEALEKTRSLEVDTTVTLPSTSWALLIYWNRSVTTVLQRVHGMYTYNPFLCSIIQWHRQGDIFWGGFQTFISLPIFAFENEKYLTIFQKYGFPTFYSLFFHPPCFYTLNPLSSIEKVYATLCCFGALTTLLLPSIWVEKWYFFCSFA